MTTFGIGLRRGLLTALFCSGSASFAQVQDVPDTLHVVVVGDIINAVPMKPIIDRISPDLSRLIGNADVAFGNFENTAIDWRRYKGAPAAEAGGDWLFATAAVPGDLKALGFDILGRANNHGTDWGVDGLLLTDALLDEAGLAHAGSGRNETAARAPGFSDGPKARIGLVSTATTYMPANRASDGRGMIPDRPGISAIALDQTILVSPERLTLLADVRDGVARDLSSAVDPDRTTVALGSLKFAPSTDADRRTRTLFAANEQDQRQVLRAVAQAHHTDDLTLFTVHWHEPSNDSEAIAPFAANLARAAVDAGADMVIGHGPHRLRGIEIYKGKPIFYSLGNFAYMISPMQPMPREEFATVGLDPATALDVDPLEKNLVKWMSGQIWYDSVVPVVRYDQGIAREIRLYPIELGNRDRGVSRGVPRLVKGDAARRILKKLDGLSRPLGTTIVERDGIGVISLSERSPDQAAQRQQRRPTQGRRSGKAPRDAVFHGLVEYHRVALETLHRLGHDKLLCGHA